MAETENFHRFRRHIFVSIRRRHKVWLLVFLVRSKRTSRYQSQALGPILESWTDRSGDNEKTHVIITIYHISSEAREAILLKLCTLMSLTVLRWKSSRSDTRNTRMRAVLKGENLHCFPVSNSCYHRHFSWTSSYVRMKVVSMGLQLKIKASTCIRIVFFYSYTYILSLIFIYLMHTI